MSFRSHLKMLVWALSGLLLLLPETLSAADPSVAELVQAAKSGAEAARVKAIDQLAAQGEKAAEAVTPLTQLLTDGSATVRAHAAHALGAIGAPSKPAAAALTSLVADKDEAVRRQAVKALVAIRPGPQVMIPLFVKLMDDSDAGVRMRILHAVSEAGPAAVPGMIEALKNEKAAYWACLVLREIGPEAKEAVPALAARLKDAKPEIRREAALTLGAMQEAAAPALPQLAAALTDEHAREAVTFAMGQIGGKLPADAEARIRANAQSDDKFLSTVSYWTLSRIHPDDKELRTKATERLVERLMDKDPYVRVAAARALAALPPAPEISLPILEKALKNADEATTRHAMDALASLGAAAVPRLIDALKHKSVRVQAAHTLSEIGAQAAPATDALAKLVGDADSRVATEAALALAKIGPDAKAAAPALAAAMKQPDSPSHAIVYALGSIGPGAVAAEPALLEAMTSKDRSLAVLGAWALTRVHPPSQQIAARAIPILIGGLEDPLPQSRQVAAEALGSLGALAKEAAGPLQKASSDKEQAVRDAAAEALRLIRGAK